MMPDNKLDAFGYQELMQILEESRDLPRYYNEEDGLMHLTDEGVETWAAAKRAIFDANRERQNNWN